MTQHYKFRAGDIVKAYILAPDHFETKIVMGFSHNYEYEQEFTFDKVVPLISNAPYKKNGKWSTMYVVCPIQPEHSDGVSVGNVEMIDIDYWNSRGSTETIGHLTIEERLTHWHIYVRRLASEQFVIIPIEGQSNAS